MATTPNKKTFRQKKTAMNLRSAVLPTPCQSPPGLVDAFENSKHFMQRKATFRQVSVTTTVHPPSLKKGSQLTSTSNSKGDNGFTQL